MCPCLEGLRCFFGLGEIMLRDVRRRRVARRLVLVDEKTQAILAGIDEVRKLLRETLPSAIDRLDEIEKLLKPPPQK